MKIPTRILNRIYAYAFGFFWSPCPICGELFGGHEWDYGNSLLITQFSGTAVCRNCGDIARKRNEDNWIMLDAPITVAAKLDQPHP